MIKIILVDNDISSLKRNKSFIDKRNHSVIAEMQDGVQLLEYCYSHKELPDIVILDVEIKNMDGVSLTDYLYRYFPSIKIIGLSFYSKEQIIKDMFGCGAYGYVWKYDHAFFLLEAINLVTERIPYLDPRLKSEIVMYRESLIAGRKIEQEAAIDYNITRAEGEIIALNAAQINYKRMADILHKQPKTIETIVNRLNKKLDIEDGHRGLLFFSLRHSLIRLARFN